MNPKSVAINHHFFQKLVIVLFALALTACANMDTVRQAPKDAGISGVFEANHELVKAAVLASMQSMNINVKDSQKTEDGFQITFTKSLSALSCGEVGRVLVVDKDETSSIVYVYSEKRSTYEFASSNQADFANGIFNGTRQILKQRLQNASSD